MTAPWPVVALGEVCEIAMGQAPAGESYNDRREGWPLIAGAGDFGDGRPRPKKFTKAPSKLSRAGDVIVGIRATIGTKVISDGVYCLGRGVAGLRPKAALNDRYLWHWLSSSRTALAAKGRGATFLQVNKTDVEEMPIPLPPMEEQRRIAADSSELLLSDKIWRFVWHPNAPVLVGFVWRFLQMPSVRRRIGTLATGTSGSMKNISQAKLMRLSIPVPPIDLQHAFEVQTAAIVGCSASAERSATELDHLFASLQHRAFAGQL